MKKFNSLKGFKEFESNTNSGYSNRIIDHLKKGFAIKIYQEDIDQFFSIINDYPNIKSISIGDELEYENEYYYFVLIGDTVYHSYKPFIGNTKLDIWVPSFEKEFESYSNPFNPYEIWDEFKLSDYLYSDDLSKILYELIDENIHFMSKGVHVEGVLEDFEIDPQEEMGVPTDTYVYFKIDNKWYKVDEHIKIEIKN